MFAAPRAFERIEPLRRLTRSLWKRYARAFKPPYFVEKRRGAFWLLDQHNIIDRTLFCFGTWEDDQVSRLLARARMLATGTDKPLFLDIGSHAGFYAVLMAGSGLFSRVLAFEPVPRHLANLHANLLLNGLAGKVEVFDLALSDQRAIMRFAEGEPDNRGNAHTLEGLSTGLLSNAPDEAIITVRAERLDDLLEVRGTSACIKIDVEGHEEATLLGMKGFLQGNTCVLQIEILPEALARVTALTESFGYRLEGQIGPDYYFNNAR